VSDRVCTALHCWLQGVMNFNRVGQSFGGGSHVAVALQEVMHSHCYLRLTLEWLCRLYLYVFWSLLQPACYGCTAWFSSAQPSMTASAVGS
jgi:hypothetical protein